MNPPIFLRRNAFAAAVFTIPLSFGLMTSHADQGPSALSSLTEATAFLTQIPSRWNSVESLQYEVDTKDTESDGFRKSINETEHDRDVLLTHLRFTFKGGDYGWKTDTLVEATGAHERVSIGGWADGTLSVLFQGPHSVLTVTKNPKFQGAVPITGCNPVMEAFSFLVSDDWQGFNCPEINLKSLLSEEVWANAARRVTSFSEETIRTQRCFKIVFGSVSGNHDVVYFTEDLAGFPIEWQHYEGSYLRRDVSMGDSMVPKALPGGVSITLPHLLVRRDYYDPSNKDVFCTSEQTLSVVALNQSIDAQDLVIDPSLADAIYDRDNDKRIPVPK